MKTRFYLFLKITSLFLLFFSDSFSKIIVRSKSIQYYAVALNNLEEHVSIEGFVDKDEIYPIVFSSLETINDIIIQTAFLTSDWKKMKIKDIKAEDASFSNFYDGNKFYRIPFEKGMKFKISYTIKTNEVKCLAKMNFKYDESPDTVKYSVVVGGPYSFSWLISKKDSIQNVLIDSSSIDNNTIYNFSCIKRESSSKCDVIAYCLLHDKNTEAIVDYNNWYLHLISQSNGISNTNQVEMEGSVTAFTDTLIYVKNLFENVRSKISYIDIEANYGAFQPRLADMIVKNKKGDCKDMANLLYQCLKSHGIESYIGDISSLHRQDDYHFPSIASFDHMICVAKINNEWLILDATDDESPFGYPSRHTQGRILFCPRNDNPLIVKVPIVVPDSNLINHQIKLIKNGSQLSGSWEIIWHGLSASELNDILIKSSDLDKRIFFDQYLKQIAPQFKVTSYTFENYHGGNVIIKAQIEVLSQSILSVDGKQYLKINFLPFPVNYVEESDCRTLCTNTLKQNVSVDFNFQKPIKLKQLFKSNYIENLLSFSMLATVQNTTEIHLNYEYINPYIEMNSIQYASYLKINKEIKKSFAGLVEFE